jgi:hypothetical protein
MQKFEANLEADLMKLFFLSLQKEHDGKGLRNEKNKVESEEE